MNENEKDEIASVIQNSAIARDPRVNRTGKDAAGMTDAFDKSVAENEAAARERFANNSAALSAYLKSQADSIPATRESIRKYEISQVADWASKKSMRNVDDMYQKFSDWSTLEVARIESEYGIAVESAKVASKAIYDEKVRMFGEGMLFSDKDNKVKVTTREECERIAKSAMEDKARLIIEGAESNRANGYSVICGNLQSLGENAHKMMIADGRSMFMSEEDAALNASSYIGKKSNELIDSYSGSGYSVLAKMLLEKYSQAGITDVYETEKNDDGSIKIDKKTGTPVFKLDAEGKPIVSKTEYNPSRRLWMSMSDLKSIRSSYDSLIAKEAQKAKLASAESELKIVGELGQLMNAGRDMFNRKMNPDGTVEDKDTFTQAWYDEVVGRMRKILENPPTKEIATRANSYIKEMESMWEKRATDADNRRKFLATHGTLEEVKARRIEDEANKASDRASMIERRKKADEARSKRDSARDVVLASRDAKAKVQAEYDGFIRDAKKKRSLGKKVVIDFGDGKTSEFDADSAIKFYYECGVDLGLNMNKADYREAIINMDANAAQFYSEVLTKAGVYVPQYQFRFNGEDIVSQDLSELPGVKVVKDKSDLLPWGKGDDENITDYPINPYIESGRVKTKLPQNFRVAWDAPDGSLVYIEKDGIERVMNVMHNLRSNGMSANTEQYKSLLLGALKKEAGNTGVGDIATRLVNSITEQYNTTHSPDSVSLLDSGYLMPKTKNQWTKDMEARLKASVYGASYNPNNDEDINED